MTQPAAPCCAQLGLDENSHESLRLEALFVLAIVLGSRPLSRLRPKPSRNRTAGQTLAAVARMLAWGG